MVILCYTTIFRFTPLAPHHCLSSITTCAGVRLHLGRVEDITNDLLEQHGGFRNYLKNEAERLNLVGKVWRCAKYGIRVEVEGTQAATHEFLHLVMDMEENGWIWDVRNEHHWEHTSRPHVLSSRFRILPNTSRFAVKGTLSDDGFDYEPDEV